MLLELGADAPDFDTGAGTFHAWRAGQWALLFSYPKAFTSVCEGELVAVARLLDDYAAAGVKVAAVSADSGADQAKFAADITAREEGCPAAALTQFADPGHAIAGPYGMLHPLVHPELAMRVSYLIDPAGKVRLAMALPPPVPRDFAALLAAAKGMQQADARKA